MANGNGKPKCPKPERLRELVKFLSVLHRDHELTSSDASTIEISEALSWLAQFLEDRNLYHKRQQLKNKHLMRLAKEHGLMEEAAQSAKPELINHILNQSPDEDDER